MVGDALAGLLLILSVHRIWGSMLLEDGSTISIFNQVFFLEDYKLESAYLVDLLYDEKVFSYCDLTRYTREGVRDLLSLHQVPVNASWIAFMNVERVRYFCWPSTSTINGFADKQTFYWNFFLAVPIIKFMGASGSINTRQGILYEKGRAVWAVNREMKEIYGEKLDGLVSMMYARDGAALNNTIRERLNSKLPTVMALNITNDPSALDGLESSVIWTAYRYGNIVFSLFCTGYGVTVARISYELKKRVAVDFGNMAILYVLLGNTCGLLSSIDPSGYNYIFRSSLLALFFYIAHFGFTIASYGACLFFWEEAIQQITNSLAMKLTKVNTTWRVVFLIAMTVFIVVDKGILLASIYGEFPYDVVNLLVIGYLSCLLLMLVYTVKLTWQLSRSVAKINNKVQPSTPGRSERSLGAKAGGVKSGGTGDGSSTPSSSSPDPASKLSRSPSPSSFKTMQYNVSGERKGEDGAKKGEDGAKKGEDGAKVASSSKLDSSNGRKNTRGVNPLQNLYEGIKDKLMRCIRIIRLNLYIIVVMFMLAALLQQRVPDRGVVWNTCIYQGITTSCIALQMMVLHTLRVAMKSNS